MLRLIITAANGAEYLAQARLEDSVGRLLCSGTAILASRQGYDAVAAGSYALKEVAQFPSNANARAEFGRDALVFHPQSGRAFEPLLVHAGTGRATYGSIRLDDALMRLVLRSLDETDAKPGRSDLVLEVRIGKKAPGYKFWAQPPVHERIEDDGVDLFDVLYPELAPYRHPNSAMAWVLYWRNERQEAHDAEQARHSLHREWEREQELRLERDRQAGQRDETSSSAVNKEPFFIAPTDCAHEPQPFGESSRRTEQACRVERDEPVVAPAIRPLFEVTPMPGVDRYGQVTNESPTCEAPAPAPSEDSPRESEVCAAPADDDRAADSSATPEATQTDTNY